MYFSWRRASHLGSLVAPLVSEGVDRCEQLWADVGWCGQAWEGVDKCGKVWADM